MDKKDILKNVYDDFFGISKKKEDEEINNQIKESLDAETLEINIPQEKESVSSIDADKMLKDSFEKIDKLYIDDKSKETLKKIIEYIRKYNEGIEKNFISFNMCIFSKSKETEQDVLHILNDNINYFSYLPKGDIGLTSFFDIESAKNIDEIYSSDNNVIVFENPNAFTSSSWIVSKLLSSVSINLKFSLKFESGLVLFFFLFTNSFTLFNFSSFIILFKSISLCDLFLQLISHIVHLFNLHVSQ